MGAEQRRMRRRERRQKIHEVWAATFADLDPADEAARAARVRELCPCEHAWSVPLWQIVFEACADPSPLVRMEALHVIEDSYALGLPNARGMGLLCAARDDPAPEVRRFAKEAVRLLPEARKHRRRDQKRCTRETAPDTDEAEGRWRA
jgi:hypothetical protein